MFTTMVDFAWTVGTDRATRRALAAFRNSSGAARLVEDCCGS